MSLFSVRKRAKKRTPREFLDEFSPPDWVRLVNKRRTGGIRSFIADNVVDNNESNTLFGDVGPHWTGVWEPGTGGSFVG